MVREVAIPSLHLRSSPGLASGFTPGVHLVAETGVLFVGAGDRLVAYDLVGARRLWEHIVDVGFLAWSAHGSIVMMSGELELVAFRNDGVRLWSASAEPPWSYRVVHEDIELDVMGAISRFPIATGPG